MSERVRDILTVIALVVVLLAAFLVVRSLLRARAEGEPEQGRPVAPAAAERPPQPAGGPKGGTPGQVPGAAGLGATAPGTAEPVSPAAAPAGVPPAPAAGESPVWKKRPPAEFTAADLAQCGRGATVDLGSYEVQSGDEFTVTLKLTAPALESLTLRLQFDTEALALVPDSAVPVGTAFRGGIECYAGRDGASMVLIHAGLPGMKNLDEETGGGAVSWRMRALRAGSTRLEVMPQSSFTNGRGEDEQYSVSGGEISVRQAE